MSSESVNQFKDMSGSTSAARKSAQGKSWQYLVVLGAFSVIVFFSFFAVVYLAPAHSAVVLETTVVDNVQKTTLDAVTDTKPQLRSADHEVTSSKALAVVSPSTNPTLCNTVELVVNSTIGVGTVTVAVHHDWAPLGAARFCELVNAKFYDDVRFFRVLKNFMAQTGMHGDPAVGKKWRKENIKDDKVTQSNKRGSVTFAMAGPNTRTTQLFFNFVHNKFLDSQGFAPFATVESGMNYIDALYNVYGEGGRGDGKDHKGPSQGRINQEGNEYLNKVFPNLSYIISATVKA